MNACPDVTWLIFMSIGAATAAIILMITAVSTAKTVVRCLLIIFFRLHKRKVYFSPFDMSLINQAIDYVEKGSWHPPKK